MEKRVRDRTQKDIALAETIILSNEEVEFTGLVHLNEQSLDILQQNILEEIRVYLLYESKNYVYLCQPNNEPLDAFTLLIISSSR